MASYPTHRDCHLSLPPGPDWSSHQVFTKPPPRTPASSARCQGWDVRLCSFWGSLSLSYFVTTLPPTSAVGGLKWYGMATRRKGDWSLLLVRSTPPSPHTHTRMFVFLWKESFSWGNAQILKNAMTQPRIDALVLTTWKIILFVIDTSPPTEHNSFLPFPLG